MTDSTRPHESWRLFLPREPWRRNQAAVTIAAAMVFLGFTLVMPFLPFFVESLGVRGRGSIARWSGLLLTVSPFLAAFLGPLWGRLAERVGMRIMVRRVLLTIALHWGLMYFVTSVWHLLALRILLGLFSGFGTMSVALVTHGCPRQRIGKAVGTLQATQILSTAVGPFVGGILAHAIGIRNTFLVTFALCSLAFFLVSVLYRDTVPDLTDPETGPVVVSPAGPVSEGVRAVLPRPAGAGRMDDRGPSFRRLLALPLFLPLLPILFFDNVVDRSLGLIVPLFVADLTGRGSAVAITGMVVSAGTFASAASAYLLGHGTGRIPPLQLLLWSLLGGSLSIAAMAFCRSIPSFAVLRVLLGLAVGGAATLSYTIGGAVLPGALRVSGYAFLSSVAMLGGAMGPILSGLIASHDLRAPLVVGGVLYAGMTLHVAILARRSGRFSGALAAMGGEASLPVPPAQEEP